MKTSVISVRYLKTLCAGLVVAGASLGGTASAKDPVNVDLITTAFGTGSYVMGTALEEVSKKHHPWLRITASESPGFIFNLRKIDREPDSQKTTIIGSGAGVAGLATAGIKPFEKKYDAPKLIANYFIGAYWLATLNPEIKSVADLAGKKVALGRAAQINWAVQPAAVITQGYGIKDATIEYVGTDAAVGALMDGNVDAAVVGGYFDPITRKMVLSPQTMEFMASGRDINFLSMDKDAIAKAVASGVKMLTLEIAPGTIDGVDKPLVVIGDTVSWMASANFDEELAYETAKLIVNNTAAFGEFHALGKLMSPEGLVYGWEQSDIHPGALRAYKEAGVLK